MGTGFKVHNRPHPSIHGMLKASSRESCKRLLNVALGVELRAQIGGGVARAGI